MTSIRRFFDSAFECHTRSRERSVLRALDDHMLRDVGLTRADVYREVSKPFWRA
jgi:uncharacterized protein YjiS (DUF1127 family)